MSTVIISGGTDGVGKAIATRLAPKHTVVILAPDADKVAQVASELQCDGVACDVSNYTQVDAAISHILTKHTSIDCVVNNAGVWIEGPLDQNDPEQMAHVLNVNALGVMYVTKAVVPTMKKQRSGRIVNVISQAGLYGKAERSVYTASKFAVTGLTKSLQFELAPFGIALTGLYPGKIKTKLFAKAGNEKNLDAALEPEEVAQTVEFILSLPATTTIPEIGIRTVSE